MIEPNTYFAPLDVHTIYPLQYIMSDSRLEMKQHNIQVRHFMILKKPDVQWDYSPWYGEKVQRALPTILELDVLHCLNGLVYCFVLRRALPLEGAKPWRQHFWMDELEWRRVLYFCPELR